MIKNENKYFIYDKPRLINAKYFARYAFVKLENIYYSVLLSLLRPPLTEKKYNVSLCAIFKNEAQYLKEWIEFHSIVGVDHFYLYNNNSNDNYMEVLTPYIEQGKVTLTEWPYDQAQLKAYNDCINNRKCETKWMGFIDIDEFVVPNKTDTVYDFLKQFENRPVVKLYWKLFGSSGRMNRDRGGLITEDFTVCWDKFDEVGKCFFNTAYDFEPSFKWNSGFHHGMWGCWKNKQLPPVNCYRHICQRGFEKADSTDFPIQINHYFTKSYKEYLEKASKGDVFFKVNPHDVEFFFRHEKYCNSSDYHVYKYLVKLKLAMGNGQEDL